MPNLYVIAGCNGAGKTTTSFTVLPEILNCKEFVNADEIARGLSPFQPETVSFKAGRIMLDRIRELLREEREFGFETTLSSRSYASILRGAKAKGYTLMLIFYWLESVDLAKSRVLERVKNGGHNIAPDTIERRYVRGVKNFFHLYREIVHSWIVYNNSKAIPQPVAKGNGLKTTCIFNDDIWKSINELK